MAFCNITAGSRFLCFSFLFTRRCISLVQWRGTPDLRSGPQAGLLHPRARRGGWRGRGCAEAGETPTCLQPPGLCCTSRAPGTSARLCQREPAAPPGLQEGMSGPAEGFPSRLRPSSVQRGASVKVPSRQPQEAVVLSSDRDGSEAALRVIPGVKYSGLASSFLSSNPVAREQETPPRKPQDSPHLAN